jgi:acyl carrier protein
MSLFEKNRADMTRTDVTDMVDLTDLIIGTTHAIVQEQGLELGEALSRDTRLFGQHGLLDSLALVSLVIAVEQVIEEQYGVRVELADDKALSQKHSPYRSIATLTDYALTQLRTLQNKT